MKKYNNDSPNFTNRPIDNICLFIFILQIFYSKKSDDSTTKEMQRKNFALNTQHLSTIFLNVLFGNEILTWKILSTNTDDAAQSIQFLVFFALEHFDFFFFSVIAMCFWHTNHTSLREQNFIYRKNKCPFTNWIFISGCKRFFQKKLNGIIIT